MSTVYIAYANGSRNDLGPADAGIAIYRKVTEGGQVLDEREIHTWTGAEIDDEDGELDTDAAERQLGFLGWRIADAVGFDRSGDGQFAAEVEPWDDGRPVAGLERAGISDERIAEIKAQLDAWLERHNTHFIDGSNLGCGCNPYQDIIYDLPEYDPEDPRNKAIPEQVDRYILSDGTEIDGEREGWAVIRP
jgi:hypothetical protein